MSQKSSELATANLVLLAGTMLVIAGLVMGSTVSKPCRVLGCGNPTAAIQTTGSVFLILGTVLCVVGICTYIIHIGRHN